MSAPNIRAASGTITGNTDTARLTSSSATNCIKNAASSNSLYKINAIYVCNIDSASRTIALQKYGQAGSSLINDGSSTVSGSTTGYLVKGLSIPAGSTYQLLDAPYYLTEDRSLVATSDSASGLLDITFAYEVIS